MKILITGASGLVGKEIGKAWAAAGHELFVLTRESESQARARLPFRCHVIQGDLVQGIVQDPRLSQIEVVMNLMGESISQGRWTAEKKKKIRDSRVLGTKHLRESLSLAKAPVRTVISTSAVGYYGERGSEELIEESTKGQGFLADVCQDWEHEAQIFKADFPQARIVNPRFGIVLSAFGGALPAMLLPYRVGVGGVLGDGDWWMSWIHIHDLVSVLQACLQNEELVGPVNAVAPLPATNREFSQSLAQCFGHNLGVPVPMTAMKIGLGEMASGLFSSQRVRPVKLETTGFQFQYPQIEKALTQVTSFFQNGESTLRSEQYFDASPELVFPFFAEARNLEKITPPLLNFKITGTSTAQMQEGTLIDYRLKVHQVPVRWRTRIEEWEPSRKFVDTQLKGPYSLWHHTHEFTALQGGTLMTDLVRYKEPLGWFGKLTAGWLVSKDVRKIFEYRRQVIQNLNFGADSN